ARSRHAKDVACRKEGEVATALWPGRLAEVREGIAASGLAYADTLPERLAPWLDKWSAQGAEVGEEACRGLVVTQTLSADVHRRVQGCLELQRVRVESLVDGLAHGDPVALRNAVPDAADLAPPSECLDLDRLARMAWPGEA